jgi:hypothetical protein
LENDLAFGERVIGEILEPGFLKPRFESYEIVDHGATPTLAERRSTVDVRVVRRNTHEVIRIEIVVVRWPGYVCESYFMEVYSCTVGVQSLGWMRTCAADLLLYAFEQEDRSLLIVHLIRFPEWKKRFWRTFTRYRSSRLDNTPNRAEGRLVPLDQIPSDLLILNETVNRYGPVRPGSRAKPTCIVCQGQDPNCWCCVSKKLAAPPDRKGLSRSWPGPTSNAQCAHCGVIETKDDPLVPIGTRDHVWLHKDCHEEWLRARHAVGA